jgi:hypothetical protein
MKKTIVSINFLSKYFGEKYDVLGRFSRFRFPHPHAKRSPLCISLHSQDIERVTLPKAKLKGVPPRHVPREKIFQHKLHAIMIQRNEENTSERRSYSN